MKFSGPTRVIGNWQPSRLERDVILTEFAAEVERLLGPFTCEFNTIRSPSYQLAGGGTPYWHRDGLGDHLSIVWSNEMPTLIVLDDTAYPRDFRCLVPDPTAPMLETRDGDIILVNNLDCIHSSPESKACQYRWFARLFNVHPVTESNIGQPWASSLEKGAASNVGYSSS